MSAGPTFLSISSPSLATMACKAAVTSSTDMCLLGGNSQSVFPVHEITLVGNLKDMFQLGQASRINAMNRLLSRACSVPCGLCVGMDCAAKSAFMMASSVA